MSPEWVGAGLLVAAVVLFFMEAQAPGLGVFGISGVLCLIVGVFVLTQNPILVAATAALSLVCLVLTVRAIIQAKRWRRYTGNKRSKDLIGHIGKTTTALSPRGSVFIGGEHWSAESDTGEPIPKDESVIVLEANGLTLRVFQADSELIGDNSDDSIF